MPLKCSLNCLDGEPYFKGRFSPVEHQQHVIPALFGQHMTAYHKLVRIDRPNSLYLYEISLNSLLSATASACLSYLNL
ncbi:hypothetical protein BDA96_04G279500 [Sorghum bicolor]|uniref:Uncharacterized protein n=1 Tax=Sorghum bicolor TaxID=4558 RepID=A0A921R8A2_SORBI|nr:hypothetical protein BDA96_04G279500 [Sorghum bicolor]